MRRQFTRNALKLGTQYHKNTDGLHAKSLNSVRLDKQQQQQIRIVKLKAHTASFFRLSMNCEFEPRSKQECNLCKN
jgi:hypothetical protein